VNYLAHALLGGGDAELEIGGLLGDFVRGRPDPALPAGLRAGIGLHRAVDSYTDRHPAVVAARRRFAPPWRRYAGILLDMWFDHCLARDFGRWSAMPLPAFSHRLRMRLHARAALLPPALRQFVAYMDANDLPAGYADADVVAHALSGISARLSRANPIGAALPVLQADDAALRRQFDAFFPDLLAFAEAWRASPPGG
jgi:acyl carrier protein phosphodiesterase